LQIVWNTFVKPNPCHPKTSLKVCTYYPLLPVLTDKKIAGVLKIANYQGRVSVYPTSPDLLLQCQRRFNVRRPDFSPHQVFIAIQKLPGGDIISTWSCNISSVPCKPDFALLAFMIVMRAASFD
jgi:hypothetical protein